MFEMEAMSTSISILGGTNLIKYLLETVIINEITSRHFLQEGKRGL